MREVVDHGLEALVRNRVRSVWTGFALGTTFGALTLTLAIEAVRGL